MKISLTQKILLTFIVPFFAACAQQQKNWIIADGRYGQTWIDGVILMEVAYKSAQDCLNNVNYELDNNPLLQRKILIEKSIALVCAEKEITKDLLKFDTNGLASPAGGLPYQGIIRLATSTEKYNVWFADKKICDIFSNELKAQNKNQDLVCP